jgi:tetratricopeptide (TPR) repeat protein
LLEPAASQLGGDKGIDVANKYTRKGRSKDNEAAVGEDEFVSFWEKAYDAIAPHARNLGYAAAGAAVMIAIVWVALYWSESKREKATEAYGHAVRVYTADLLPEDGKKPDDDLPHFKTAKERAEAALAELDQLEKDHGSTSVAKEAHAFRLGVLYDLGRYDDARATAEKVPDEGKADPVKILAREDAGLALEDTGKLDEAMAVYKELAEKGGDFFRERALFDQARVLAKKGDMAGAKDLYKKILEKQPSGLLHDEVQNRLNALGG